MGKMISRFDETEEEAAKRILNGMNLHDFDSFAIMNNQVVMAIYSIAEKTKGGILRPEDKESQYQGKTGLIIGLGPTAYKDESGQWFKGGKSPKLGDWVVIRASDGWRLDIHKVQCRMFDDTLTRMIIPHPELIW